MMGSEAKVEVVAEPFIRLQGFNRPICRHNNPNIALNGNVFTQMTVFSIL